MIAALFAPLLALTFVVVPLDDRPVTRRLPATLAAIAGVRVEEPPRALLGRYLEPGDPDAILRWLRDDAPAGAAGVVVSSDMIAYGGLVASRTPDVSLPVALTRLRALAALRSRFNAAPFDVFGTVMRLAPTGVPATGASAHFFAAGNVWPKLQQYANLPDPPDTPASIALAARLRTELGPALEQYLAARARDRDADAWLLAQLFDGSYDRVVLGQDDAGPRGLHLRDLAALRGVMHTWRLESRAGIEPGADELGMVLVARELARRAGITPRVRVVYSRADGGSTQDPLEFGPVDGTVAAVIRTCGAVRADGGAPADIELDVNVPATNAGDMAAFAQHIAADPGHAAVADVTFLAANNYAEQRALFDALVANGSAGRVAAFASWNTVANTVGTALPEAIAALAGGRLHTYDATAHARFTAERYIDDIAFHNQVRPALNDTLTRDGIGDHTLLAPAVAAATEREDRHELWPLALDVLRRVASAFADRGLTITLPWNRTFETEIDLRLAPREGTEPTPAATNR